MDSDNQLPYDFSNPRPYGRYTSKTSVHSLPSLPTLNSQPTRRNLSDIEYEFDEEPESSEISQLPQNLNHDYDPVTSTNPSTDRLESYVQFDLSLRKSTVSEMSPSRNITYDSPKDRLGSIVSRGSMVSREHIPEIREETRVASPLKEPEKPIIDGFDVNGANSLELDSNAVNDNQVDRNAEQKSEEFHQTSTSQLQIEKEPHEKYENDDEDDFFNSTTDWKAMHTISELDYYNEKGELTYTLNGEFDQSAAGSRGYTKIDTEAQVARYEAMNKKTDFLFAVTETIADVNDEDEDYDDVDNLNSAETLESTKSMLKDSQKIAYAAIVRLVQCEMATVLALLKSFSSPSIAKTLSASQKSMANWTQITSKKVYDHLGLKEEERAMIERLLGHGLEVRDLTFSLLDGPQNSDKLVWILICDLYLLLLEEGYYDSRSRTLLVTFAHHLKVPAIEVWQFERRLIESLEVDAEKATGNKDELLTDKTFIERRIKRNQRKRLAYIGLATLGGGLAIGLSAGLLAPVIGAGIAAGLTTVGIGGTSGFLAGIGGSAIITTTGVLTGVRVGSKAGSRRLGEVHTFEVKPLHDNKRTNLVLTVSGWMNGELDDVRLPFLTVDPVIGDLFSLLWEPEMLQLMGQTIGILALEALLTSIQQILGATILTTLMSAIQLPMALLKLSYLLDNPWNVSLTRAWKAGKILADTLIAGNLGVRPITLVGFLLGSRLIYSCLIELSKRGGYGIVEDVIILGTPITVNADEFAQARSVVSGRFVNGYSQKDWVLGYLFRATGGGLKSVAGLTPIEGVENLDCTEFVLGHMLYRKAIPKILKELDWEVLLEEFAEIEEPDPEQGERERKLINELDGLRTQMEQNGPKRKGWKKWFKPKTKNWWQTVGGDEGLEGAERENFKSGEEEGEGSKRSNQVKPDGNEEYKVETGPVFDVSALLEEVKELEQILQVDKGVNVKNEEEEKTEQKAEKNSLEREERREKE